MNDAQLLRYARHILLDELGIEGQEKLLAARVLIVGAGGLGSPAAMYLASAGVGTIVLADHDVVEISNLQRQIMHNTNRLGQLKAESGRQTMLALNPELKIEIRTTRMDESSLDQEISQVDVVLDCTDNFATRHAINRACVEARVPLVSGSAIRLDGQVAVFDSRSGTTPCYACLFPPDQHFEEEQCSTMGVFAPLVGSIGTMQAAEALKIVAELGESLAQRLLLLDAKHMECTSIRTKRNDECVVCGQLSK